MMSNPILGSPVTSRTAKTGAALLAVLALLTLPAAAQSPGVKSISVEGTEFVVALSDGRTLRSKELVGAVLDVRFEGQPAKVRIAAVEVDPDDKSGTVWLHTLEGRQADGSWTNLCVPGPDKRQQGFPLMVKGTLEFVCSAGALAKCVRFGYRPWASGPDGKSLAPQHAACVRMVRGDYGGSEEPWTKDGMWIDIYDPQGIQVTDNDPDLVFEAGWGPDGAVCVHHVRVKENTTLEALEARYPRLRGRTGAICTEAYARSLGAIVLNRSKD
jgi:hypothetical protein